MPPNASALHVSTTTVLDNRHHQDEEDEDDVNNTTTPTESSSSLVNGKNDSARTTTATTNTITTTTTFNSSKNGKQNHDDEQQQQQQSSSVIGSVGRVAIVVGSFLVLVTLLLLSLLSNDNSNKSFVVGGYTYTIPIPSFEWLRIGLLKALALQQELQVLVPVPITNTIAILIIYMLMMFNLMWFVSMVLSIGLDDISSIILGRGGQHPNPTTTTETKTTTETETNKKRTIAERPCTIGYNIQIQSLTGLLTYTIALLALLYSDNTKDTSGTYIATVPYNENEILFHTTTLVLSFTLFQQEWMPFLVMKDHRNREPVSLVRYLESILVVPTLLTIMLIVSTWNNSSNSIITSLISSSSLSLLLDYWNVITRSSSTSTDTIRSILYTWISLKLVDLFFQYYNTSFKQQQQQQQQQQLRNTVLQEYPGWVQDTPLFMKRNEILTAERSEDHITSSTNNLVDYTSTSLGTQDVWNIYGNQYDCSAFVPYHPGGVESIMLAANRDDATALFQSYHPFNMKKARAVLEKYRINSNNTNKNEDDDCTATNTTATTTTTKDNSNNNKDLIQYGHENDIFYDILCQKVAKTLQNDYNIHPIHDRGASFIRLFSYGIFLAVAAFSFYKHCQGSIWYSILFALAGDICGAHIGHDGGHFAISSKYPRINDIGVWAFFTLTNPIMWQHQHTYAHHSFTNDEHKDPDLHHFKGAFKIRPTDKLEHYFMSSVDSLRALDKDRKYFFWFLMYMFSQTSSGLCYFFPGVFVMDRSYHGVVPWSDRRQWHRTLQLLTHWVLHILAIVVAPFLAHTNKWMGLLQVSLHLTVSSIVFSFLTQVGHLSDIALNNDNISKERPNRHVVAQNSWAAEQVVTSQDFAPQSPLAFFFGGGLSIQIEHHLFPGLNHCHLTKIQPIVEATCKEYNVTYTKYETWYEAFTVTVNYLTSVAKNERD